MSDTSVNKISLPWNAWHEDAGLQVSFPANYSVDYFTVKERGVPAATDLHHILEKLAARLSAKKPSALSVAIDDLTRPLSYENFFNLLLEYLESFDFINRINIIVALGTHGPLNNDEIAKKVGTKIMADPRVVLVNHNWETDVIETEVNWGNVPLKLNRYFMQGDFRIVLSTLIPHPFAGFSGGSKSLVPGLANLEITRKTHQSVLMGFMGKIGDAENNRFRKTIDDFANQIGVDYFVGFLCNSQRQIVQAAGGELLPTYYDLVQKAGDLYTSTVSRTYDLVWLNSYPKDGELVQIDTAMNPVNSAPQPFWHENSLFVISAACAKGMGRHALFEDGGLLHRKPFPKRQFKDNKFFYYIPGISGEEFYKLYWEGYSLFGRLDEMMEEIRKQFSALSEVRTAIFATASIQLTTTG